MSASTKSRTRRGADTERWFVRDLRKLAATATAGLLLGATIGGIGSRLAMMLLARLNPEDTGRISDDGFMMGTFRVAETLNLVLFCSILGVLGGVIFLAVRRLRFGPPWFRRASMAVGPGVVVGALLVHQGGVDFILLQPAWLAIALFVAIPGLFGFAMDALGDRWLDDGSWFMATERAWIAGLGSVLLLGPAMILVLGGFLVRWVWRSVPAARRLAEGPWLAAVGRAVFVAVFAWGLVDLVRDTVALV